MKKCKIVRVYIDDYQKKKVRNLGNDKFSGVYENPDIEKIIDEYLAKGYEVKAWDGLHQPSNNVAYLTFYLEKDETEDLKKNETGYSKTSETGYPKKNETGYSKTSETGYSKTSETGRLVVLNLESLVEDEEYPLLELSDEFK